MYFSPRTDPSPLPAGLEGPRCPSPGHLLRHPAASVPGTQRAGTVGHPRTTQPPNSLQRPINNFCAKATATAACHGGAAGESKNLAKGLGLGSWRRVRGGYNLAETSPR